jgi:hypothetical protein
VDLPELLGHAAERRLQRHHHVVLLVAQDEVVGLALRDEHRECLRDGAHRHAEIGRALAVELDVELWIRETQVAVDVHEAGQLPQARDHAAGHLRQLVEARARPLDHHLDVGLAAPREAGRVDREDHRLGNLHKLRHQLGDEILLLHVALVPVAQAREHAADRGARRRAEAHADRGEEALDVGLLEVELLHLLERALGVGAGGALGRADHRDEAAAVLDREERARREAVEAH